jgi:hypothetical protein
MQNLTQMMQAHVANLLSPSAARRMGPQGTLEAARTFLRQLDLRDFSNPKSFALSLEAATLLMKDDLPHNARHWGSARKFLNLFLRDATYNYHLREAFDLQRIEKELELPLDSFSAKGVMEEAKNIKLPRWRGVIHLLPEVSDNYQRAASMIASSKSPPICRAHLDLIYWRRSRENPS